MADYWIIPAAVEAYRQRGEIARLWDRIFTLLLGRKSQLAVTGLSGAGKTVFLDHLTGKAFQQGYQPPDLSQAMERGRAQVTGQRVALSVIPGQDAQPRHVGFDELFSGRRPVDGVIHVVCNGYVSPRNPGTRKAVLEEAGVTSLPEFRQNQLKKELADLAETLEAIRGSLRRHRKPAWMLVATAKADLYDRDLETARAYYSPGGSGPFVERMQRFSAQVGTDNFRWDALPVCAWLEDFEWNAEVARSTLKPAERDHLLAQFARVLEGHCGN